MTVDASACQPHGDRAAKEDEHFQNMGVLAESKNKAVLILGGSNFMGRALVELLVERQVCLCIVNRGRRHWDTADTSLGKAARVIADRRDTEIFASRLAHATRQLGRSWDLVADFSAFDGKDICAALAGLGGSFGTYAYISSDSVYEVTSWAAEEWKPRKSEGDRISVTEDADDRPQDPALQRKLKKADSYGHGKLDAEEALSKELPAENCRSVSLRLPDVIGPYDGTLRLWAYWHWLRAGEAGAPPPQVKTFKRHTKKARREDGTAQEKDGVEEEEIPPDPPLALVFSRDVARFIVALLDRPASQDAPRCDAVNLACERQAPLGELLGLLAAASGLERERPRTAGVKRPKTFLPSVDRPWPLNLSHAKDAYGFVPTSLEDALKSCADFFKEGCSRFPKEARRAAKKLPQDASEIAIRLAGLQDCDRSSDSS